MREGDLPPFGHFPSHTSPAVPASRLQPGSGGPKKGRGNQTGWWICSRWEQNHTRSATLLTKMDVMLDRSQSNASRKACRDRKRLTRWRRQTLRPASSPTIILQRLLISWGGRRWWTRLKNYSRWPKKSLSMIVQHEMFEGSSSDITRGQKKKTTNMKRKGAETKIWWGNKNKVSKDKIAKGGGQKTRCQARKTVGSLVSSMNRYMQDV